MMDGEGRRRFGHVADQLATEPPKRISTETPAIPSEDGVRVPNFDQAQVDYLKKIFLDDPVWMRAKSLDGAVQLVSSCAAMSGKQEVINHIQNLIDRAKEKSK